MHAQSDHVIRYGATDWYSAYPEYALLHTHMLYGKSISIYNGEACKIDHTSTALSAW